MADWKVNWGGQFTALCTPFTSEGALDEEKMAQLVDTVIQEGVSGVIVAGHQGEFWLLSDDERKRVFEIAVQAARGRAKVIGGTTDVSAQRVVSHTTAAREAGADGVMVLPPLHAAATRRDIMAYYEQVSAEGGLPILVYNYPQMTGINLTELLPELAKIERVSAVKQSSPDWNDVVHTLKTAGDQLRVFSGLAAYRGLASICMGVVGLVSSAEVNVMGRAAIQLWDQVNAGDLVAARRTQLRAFDLERGLETTAVGNSYGATKTAMNLRGRPGGTVRPPHLPPTPQEEQAIRDLLQRLDLLVAEPLPAS